MNEKLQFIGKGGNANVYRIKGSDRCVKIYHEDAQQKNDFDILEVLQESPYFPKVYSHTNEHVIMQYVPHVPVFKCVDKRFQSIFSLLWNRFKGKYKKKKIKEQLQQAIEYCLSKGVFPIDFAQNVALDRKGNIIFIDVGHFEKFQDVPSNLVQNKKNMIQREMECIVFF